MKSRLHSKQPNELGKFLLMTFSHCKKYFISVGIFSFFINVLMLVAPLYMLQVFDRVLASGSYDTLIYLSIIALFALLILGVLDMVRNFVLVRVGNWIDQRLSINALQSVPEQVLKGYNYGAQCLKDVARIRGFLCGQGIYAFFDAPWTPLFIVIIYMLHPSLGTVALIGAVLLFSLAIINERFARKPLAQSAELEIRNQSQIDTAMRNTHVIQAMGMMPNLMSHWSKKNEELLQWQSLASRQSGVIMGLSKFVRMSLQISILGIGAYYVVQSIITPGAMIAASILLGRALAPIEQSMSSWKAMIQARQAYQRVKRHFFQSTISETLVSLPDPKGKLVFEEVSYLPVGQEKLVVKGISFVVQPGEAIGIIGPTAAGKSTLLSLLVGALQPTRGNVRLDSADVYSWERQDFGRHVGYLPQDIELFPGTVAQNIARMAEEVDSDAVIAASKLTNVHDMILHLPDGYDTKIGVDGVKLSGGQQQRIALARAVFGDPQVIVLDEANSNLDQAGDNAILKTLKQLKKQGKTLVIVTHRTQILDVVDKILVMEQGIIRFYDSKNVVLEQLKTLHNKKSTNTTTNTAQPMSDSHANKTAR